MYTYIYIYISIERERENKKHCYPARANRIFPPSAQQRGLICMWADSRLHGWQPTEHIMYQKAWVSWASRVPTRKSLAPAMAFIASSEPPLSGSRFLTPWHCFCRPSPAIVPG